MGVARQCFFIGIDRDWGSLDRKKPDTTYGYAVVDSVGRKDRVRSVRGRGAAIRWVLTIGRHRVERDPDVGGCPRLILGRQAADSPFVLG